MAIALVQQASNTGATVTLPGATTPGNFLVAVLGSRNAPPSTGPVSAHGTWTLVSAATSGTGGTKTTEIWTCTNIVGVTTTVAIPNPTNDVGFVGEFSGIRRTLNLDQVASASGNSASPVTGTTPVTSQAEELLIGGLSAAQGGLTYSAPINGFVLQAQLSVGGGGAGVSAAWLSSIVAATGAVSSGATLSSSDDWVGTIATFLAPIIEAGTGVIAGTSTLTGAAVSLDLATGNVAGTSALTATGGRFRKAVGNVAGTSALTVAGRRSRSTTVAIATDADLIAFGAVLVSELVLIAVSPAVVESGGGEPIELFGTFPVGVPFHVYVGPAGNVTDPEAYSGVPGRGYEIVATRPNRVTVYCPALPPGTFTIFADNGDSSSLISGLTVLPRQFRSGVYGLRGVLPNWYKVGPKNLEREP